MRRTSKPTSVSSDESASQVAAFVKHLAFDDVRYRLAIRGLGLEGKAPAYEDVTGLEPRVTATDKRSDHA